MTVKLCHDILQFYINKLRFVEKIVAEVTGCQFADDRTPERPEPNSVRHPTDPGC